VGTDSFAGEQPDFDSSGSRLRSEENARLVTMLGKDSSGPSSRNGV